MWCVFLQHSALKWISIPISIHYKISNWGYSDVMSCRLHFKRPNLVNCINLERQWYWCWLLSQLFAAHNPTVRIRWLSSIYSTKALCHHRIVESPNISFQNTSFNNAVVSLGIFFKHTQNLIAQRCYTDISIFSEYSAIHCLAIYECSASYTNLLFLSSRQLLYTSPPTFSCVWLAEKIAFSLSPCAQSFAVGVRQHAFR